MAAGRQTFLICFGAGRESEAISWNVLIRYHLHLRADEIISGRLIDRAGSHIVKDDLFHLPCQLQTVRRVELGFEVIVGLIPQRVVLLVEIRLLLE